MATRNIAGSVSDRHGIPLLHSLFLNTDGLETGTPAGTDTVLVVIDGELVLVAIDDLPSSGGGNVEDILAGPGISVDQPDLAAGDVTISADVGDIISGNAFITVSQPDLVSGDITLTFDSSGLSLGSYLRRDGTTTLTGDWVVGTQSIGLNTATPDRRLDILDTANPQLRLTHTDGTRFTDIQAHNDATYGGLSILPALNASGLNVVTLFGTTEGNGLTFLDDGNLWMRTTQAKNMSFAIASGQSFNFISNFGTVAVILGPAGITGAANFKVPTAYSVEDASTNTVLQLLQFDRTTSAGAAGAGIGARINWRLDDSNSTTMTASEWDVVADTVTAGAVDTSIRFRVDDANALKEILRIDGSFPGVLISDNATQVPDARLHVIGTGHFSDRLNLDSYTDILGIAVPANPAAGTRRLFTNTATGELSVRTNAGTTVSLEAGGSGEANTASNVGAGVGVFKQKTGVDLEFKSLTEGSTKMIIISNTDDVELDVDETFIDHDALLNFVANEHINHTAVTLTAGLGLSGGGDISANRTFALDIDELTEETAIDEANDFIPFHDASAGAPRKVRPNDIAPFVTNATGTLPINRGGTGQTTQTAAFNALSPLTTDGDIIQHDGANNVRLPIGAAGTVLTSVSGNPAWAIPGGGTAAWTTIVKAADTAITSDATVNADASLTFATVANTNYLIRMMIIYTSPAAADIKYIFTHTGTTTDSAAGSWRLADGDTAFANVLGDADPLTGENIQTTTDTELNMAWIHVFLRVGASGGVFTFNWAQNTSDAGNTTVFAGSFLEYLAETP